MLCWLVDASPLVADIVKTISSEIFLSNYRNFHSCIGEDEGGSLTRHG